ncbi:MAG TPA: hypothetical protein VKD22_16765 [Ramlibacter sp.]|nr:hypothetical protein [Ramlibacter sp.]
MSWDPVWETVYRSHARGQYPGEDVIRFVTPRFTDETEVTELLLIRHLLIEGTKP